MAQIRAQVTSWDSAKPGDADSIVNTVYFETDELDPFADADYQALAEDLANGWATKNGRATGCDRYTAKLYSLSDPKPRPVKGEHTAQNTKIQSGVREVALCLSFFSERNLPRRRGRLYLGPFGQSLGERPSTTHRTQALEFVDLLTGLGGVNVQWCVYSPSDQGLFRVTDAWVDDEWDTMRSRGLKGTTRDVRTGLNG